MLYCVIGASTKLSVEVIEAHLCVRRRGFRDQRMRKMKFLIIAMMMLLSLDQRRISKGQ
jgi:hypothetical protein